MVTRSTITHFGMISDTYLTDSAKGAIRKERSSRNIRVSLSRLDQNMVQWNKWQEFLHSDENKEHLLELIWMYFTQSTYQTRFSFPVTVKVKLDTYKIVASH